MAGGNARLGLGGHRECQGELFFPVSGENKTWDVEEKVGLAVPAENGDLILGMSVGLTRLNLESGDVAIVDPEKDLPNNRFNDGKVDPEVPWGGRWASMRHPTLAAFTA